MNSYSLSEGMVVVSDTTTFLELMKELQQQYKEEAEGVVYERKS